MYVHYIYTTLGSSTRAFSKKFFNINIFCVDFSDEDHLKHFVKNPGVIWCISTIQYSVFIIYGITLLLMHLEQYECIQVGIFWAKACFEVVARSVKIPEAIIFLVNPYYYVLLYLMMLCCLQCLLLHIYVHMHLLITKLSTSLGVPLPNLLTAVTLTMTLPRNTPSGSNGAVNVSVVVELLTSMIIPL